jgi:hypothetical protein
VGVLIAHIQDVVMSFGLPGRAGDIGEKMFSGGAGSVAGKLVGSVAGIILLIKLVTEAFYNTPVGHRTVLEHGEQPIRRRAGIQIGRFRIPWVGPKTGPYKITTRRVGIKLPFYTTARKVCIQKRIQILPPFIVDCPDGQFEFVAELATRIPCELDGPEYADYPARVVIASSEPDQVFESYTGSALMEVLERSDKDARKNRQWLCDSVNEISGEAIEEVGYILAGINLRSRARTAIQKAIDEFGFKEPQSSFGHTEVRSPSGGNVLELPHPIVTAVALPLGQTARQPE